MLRYCLTEGDEERREHLPRALCEEGRERIEDSEEGAQSEVSSLEVSAGASSSSDLPVDHSNSDARSKCSRDYCGEHGVDFEWSGLPLNTSDH